MINNNKNITGIKTIHTYLTKRGYMIPRKNLSDNDFENIQKQLTFEPVINKNFTSKFKKAKTISLMQITKNLNNENLIIIPRFFKLNLFNLKVIATNLKNNKEIDINFKGKLNENQITTLVNTYDTFLKDMNMLYCLPCGFGKTVIAIYILCKLKLKTFILVHKVELLDQWIDRLKSFTDIKDENIGIIGNGKIKVNNDNKIIFGMEQTIMNDLFDSKLIPDDIGLLICDECHHLGAEKFNKSIQKIPSKYFISLSATPYRNDKMDIVYKSFLGYNEYSQKRGKTDIIIVRKIDFKLSDKEVKDHNYIFTNSKQLQRTINYITKNIDERNLLIVKIVQDGIKLNRKILILSDRILHLKLLYYLIFKYYTENKKDIKISRLFEKYSENLTNCDILLATYSKAAEGLDVPQLNTLILSTPKANVEQSCGRILRNYNGTTRFIFDIVDSSIENANYLYYSRQRYYKKSKFIITSPKEEIENYFDYDKYLYQKYDINDMLDYDEDKNNKKKYEMNDDDFYKNMD